MDAGITWLDWAMAVLTVVGFVVTGCGLYQAWDQARKATSAADAARQAVSTTRRRLLTNDLVNEFGVIRQLANQVIAATEANNVEVAKFMLVQLSDSMRRATVLARDKAGPTVSDAIVTLLDGVSRQASSAKAELAKRATPKVRTYTAELLPQLADVNHALLEFETFQKYALNEEA